MLVTACRQSKKTTLQITVVIISLPFRFRSIAFLFAVSYFLHAFVYAKMIILARQAAESKID